MWTTGRAMPKAGDVLLQVLAAGVSNPEINTRLGWYSETISTATAAIADE